MLSGLEVVHSLNDAGIETRRGIEVVVWTDEEGVRFSRVCMGSNGFAGVFSVPSILQTTDDAGITVGSELKRIGYAGQAAAGDHRLDSYFELHIEQDSVLDRSGIDVGIVLGGVPRQTIRCAFIGETAHVASPMVCRRNALVGAAYAIGAVNDIGLKYHESGGRATVTGIDCEPNKSGTTPDFARITANFRHPDATGLARMAEDIKAGVMDAAQRSRVDLRVENTSIFDGFSFSPELIHLLQEVAGDLGVAVTSMYSQAAHDAYSISKLAPTAMIFTPCKDGITHNHDELAEMDRTRAGVDLLLNAAERHANRAR